MSFNSIGIKNILIVQKDSGIKTNTTVWKPQLEILKVSLKTTNIYPLLKPSPISQCFKKIYVS